MTLRSFRPADEDRGLLVRHAWTGAKNYSFGASRSRPAAAAENGPSDPEFLRRTPLYLTRSGCEFWDSPDRVYGGGEFFYVVGDDLADFALALALDRLYGSAVWVPASLVDFGPHHDDGFRSLFANHAKQWLDVSRDGRPRVVFTSASLDIEEDIARLVRALGDRHHWGSETLDRGVFEPPPAMPQVDPMRLCDAQHAFVRREELFAHGVAVGTFPAPLPTGCDDWEQGALLWETDVKIEPERIPPRSRLNALVADMTGFEDCDVRSSSAWLTYCSRRVMGIGGLELRRLPRVKPRTFDCVAAFSALLEPHGAKCVPSPVGIFTKRVLEMWGGLAPLASDLRDPAVRAMLQAFRPNADQKRPDDHASTEGAAKGTSPGTFVRSLRRRALSFEDCRRSGKWPSDDALRRKLDELSANGVLRRGFCLKCTHCRFFSWYRAADVEERFTCLRCGSRVQLGRATWIEDSPEPTWSYLLDEMLFEVLPGLSPVILALDTLKADSQSFFFAPEMEVVHASGEKFEVDLWVMVDGRIVVGEAKTSPSLGKNNAEVKKAANRLGLLARAVTADEVVLATNQPEWTPPSVSAMRNALEGTRARLSLMCGVEQEALPPRPPSVPEPP